jgi:hypothetical protein
VIISDIHPTEFPATTAKEHPVQVPTKQLLEESEIKYERSATELNIARDQTKPTNELCEIL